ncbi:hypothetical protein [Natrinema limicola]|uniref:Uncharacterized protein n=1 Tax=Natrinema limicola JCM 13563 TaxID=1230457 RepID=M0CE17_9EURY|nr:hypothetical protein [Natrinema limicola]ELZ20893.1 hypothetical protein C476_09668 [Natrinema limicola JCM 13563]
MASDGDGEGTSAASNASVGPAGDPSTVGDTDTTRADGSGTSDGVVPAPVEDASGYGLSLTLLGGVLLALAYYGYIAVTGPQTLGQAIPGPFYLLVFALLFVLELFQSRERGAIAVVRATALALFYGGLTAFAIEGSVYLWRNPSVALDGYVGVTVLAVSLVVAALAYFLYLAALESSTAGK